MLPREKLKNRGVSALSETELIAIILGSGIKDRDYLKIASSVYSALKRSKSFPIPLIQLQKISGLGEVKSMQIAAAIELGARISTMNSKSRFFIKNSEDAHRLLLNLASKKREYVKGIFLNARYELLSIKTVAIGTFNRVNVNARDIATYALEENAAFVILAHNHPSGETAASNQDVLVTKEIFESLKLLDIKLLDHIIISRNGWSSVAI